MDPVDDRVKIAGEYSERFWWKLHVGSSVEERHEVFSKLEPQGPQIHLQSECTFERQYPFIVGKNVDSGHQIAQPPLADPAHWIDAPQSARGFDDRPDERGKLSQFVSLDRDELF